MESFISIHALLAESDNLPGKIIKKEQNFYPRSPCGERRDPGANSRAERQISIHALLAESDSMMLSMGAILILFLSTLSLRRATVSPDTSSTQCRLFLSTLSLRRATCVPGYDNLHQRYFYPRSPCGERQTIPRGGHINKANFYPRSPCGERLRQF